jgi:hypothetical protein
MILFIRQVKVEYPKIMFDLTKPSLITSFTYRDRVIYENGQSFGCGKQIIADSSYRIGVKYANKFSLHLA